MKALFGRFCVALTMVCTPLAAVQVAFVEESPDRGWFTVIWGAVPSAPLSYLENGSNSDAGAIDGDAQVRVDYIAAYEAGMPGPPTPFSDMFFIQFSDSSRLFSASSLVGFNGTAVLPLPGELHGAQVIYGKTLPPDGSAVPDRLATGWMLGAVVLGSAVARFRRSPVAAVR